ncbi:hypothetical protein OB236_38930 [Paenibacillus sp. WQ 127069]|uniref:Uncharacterized protein n=1 Tax=Paenibacillus baimaensis TaxID=2982185 RepID=A0ABT2UTW8_9BACL|nr:hypothetical protein [Paenibacillus sp. WQ 127069]MCU6798118.1 hypothetical protein [Paenibacillus sp. WQ 127069]
MEDTSPRYITRSTIENLIVKLNLPALDPYSQDWDLEMADSSRVAEFISFYEEQVLSENERFGLMALIIASYDDFISSGNEPDLVWSKIRYYLIQDFVIHKNTILYWVLEDNEIDNCFAVTPLMRDVLATKN